MYCARCGAAAGTGRHCLVCGADLNRAGALRMTSGTLPDLGEGLGLPEEIIRRHQEEMATRVRQRAQPPQAQHPPAQHPPAQHPPAEPPAAPHVLAAEQPEDDLEPRAPLEPPERRVALTVALLVLVAALAVVGFLAVRFRDLGTGRASSTAPTSTAPPSSSQPASPSPTMTPTPSPTPTPTPSPSPTMTLPPEASRRCSDTVQTNEQTSCGTALAMERLARGKSGTFDIQVTSPTSGRTFSSTCVKGNPYTVCTAGVAKAWIKG